MLRLVVVVSQRKGGAISLAGLPHSRRRRREVGDPHTVRVELLAGRPRGHQHGRERSMRIGIQFHPYYWGTCPHSDIKFYSILPILVLLIGK
jgi:hypothetical protein